jgi:cytidyltransferase-like protein
MKIVVVSGGFDPIHSGHISYLQGASKLGDKLIVALNSDDWLTNKKSSCFMPFHERKTVLENLSMVDKVIGFEDDDKKSAINALLAVKEKYPSDDIIFANGGDRNKKNIPEMSLKGIEFAFGVGGDDKKNSSSWILKKWKYYTEKRRWGMFINLFEEKNTKVKELIVDPGKGTSYQRHLKRHEIWLVSKGTCVVNYSKANSDERKSIELKTFDQYYAQLGEWHQITNPFNEPCHIVEIQYGEACEETDIERLDYYS